MKKYIKKNRSVLVFIILFVSLLTVSCSFVETRDDIGQIKASCKNKHLSLVADNNHRLVGEALVYKGSMQGKQTATCHVLDMNGFTVAHPTLPLPSHIKITNTATNKAVVVKVNDRAVTQSPNAVLQVTPAVANVLGAKSAFPVKIELIPTNRQVSRKNTQGQQNKRVLLSPNAVATKKPKDPSGAKYYIVVGTYASQDEAFARFTRLSSIGIANSTMETRKKGGRLLHMVRIGPFYQQDAIDAVKDRLQNDGLVKFTVVKN